VTDSLLFSPLPIRFR